MHIVEEQALDGLSSYNETAGVGRIAGNARRSGRTDLRRARDLSQGDAPNEKEGVGAAGVVTVHDLVPMEKGAGMTAAAARTGSSGS